MASPTFLEDTRSVVETHLLSGLRLILNNITVPTSHFYMLRPFICKKCLKSRVLHETVLLSTCLLRRIGHNSGEKPMKFVTARSLLKALHITSEFTEFHP